MSQVSYSAPQIRFCESVFPYKNGILIPNYGSDNIKARSDEYKGYILFLKNNKLHNFIPPNGILKQPTAMTVYKNNLFICDINKLWIYNLKNLQNPPAKIDFYQNDVTVNDITRVNKDLYVTVTNSNRVYKINLKDKPLTPHKWIDIPSPNGITAYKDTLYIASIPSDYKNITDKNVIYIIKDRFNPTIEKFNTHAALYDGAAISKDGKTLYVSDWKTSSVFAIDTKTKQESVIYYEKGISPADITIHNNKLIIPDMVNHRVIIKKIH